MIQFITKTMKGFGYAFNGIFVAFKEQSNLKIHLLAVVCVIVAGFWFQISILEWAIVFLTFGTVIVAELLNTAIEYIVNFISPEHHVMAGKIKDVSAGAVLVSAATAAIVALFIFGTRILKLWI